MPFNTAQRETLELGSGQDRMRMRDGGRQTQDRHPSLPKFSSLGEVLHKGPTGNRQSSLPKRPQTPVICGFPSSGLSGHFEISEE